MAPTDALNHRLSQQYISSVAISNVKQLVSWMGAVQAQDYLGSLWALGLRLKDTTEKAIEQAIEQKEIIRTWPMRGTLHFVAAEDAHWMLSLLAPRVIKKAASIHKASGLDDVLFKKSSKIITKALVGNKQLTRNELYEILEKNKIRTDTQRGIHILGVLAQQSLICLGPKKGKQATFVLLDEWFPKTKWLEGDEALGELAARYFNSHGPATTADFAWWTGLTLTEARRGIEIAKSQLREVVVQDQPYLLSNKQLKIEKTSAVFLLPSFDEYLVAYKDRSFAFTDKHTPQSIRSVNGLLSPVIILNGKVAGTWKRTLSKKGVEVETKLFGPVSKVSQRGLQKAIRKYGEFLGLEPSWKEL